MTGNDDNLQDEVLNPIPVFIATNPRELISPRQIPLNKIFHDITNQIQRLNKASDEDSRYFQPLYPLNVIWHPTSLYLELNEKPVEKKLLVYNSSARPIYVHSTGFTNDTVRLGSCWQFHPKTRFFLAPGMNVKFVIKVFPKEESIISGATTALDIAAAHMRDPVVRHFKFPITVKFLKYIGSKSGEE